MLPSRDQLVSTASRPTPPSAAPPPILLSISKVEAVDSLERGESRGHDWGTLVVAAICGALLCLALLSVASYCYHSGQMCERCAGPGETKGEEREKTAASAAIADDDQPINHRRGGLVSPREIREAVCPDGSCQKQPSSNQRRPCRTPYLPNYTWEGEASVEGPSGSDGARSEGALLRENVTESRVKDTRSVATALPVWAPIRASADEPKQDACASTSDVGHPQEPLCTAAAPARRLPPEPTAAPNRTMSNRPHNKSAALRLDERVFLPIEPGPIAEHEKKAPRWFIAAPLPPIRDPWEATTVAKAAHNVLVSSSWACGVLDNGSSPASKPEHSPTTEATSQGTLSPGQASADQSPGGGSGDTPDACCGRGHGGTCARTPTTSGVPHACSPPVPPQWEVHPSLSSTSIDYNRFGRRPTLRMPFGPIARNPVGYATERDDVDSAAPPRYTRRVARTTLHHASQQAQRSAPSLHRRPLSRGLPVVVSRMPHRMMLGQQALKVLPPAMPGSSQSAGGCAEPFGLSYASAENPLPSSD